MSRGEHLHSSQEQVRFNFLFILTVSDTVSHKNDGYYASAGYNTYIQALIAPEWSLNSALISVSL